MEELKKQVCPICGITRGEQRFQQELASAEFRKNWKLWKQRNAPSESAPGLPLTDEERVHYALWLYQNDSSKEVPVVSIARAAQEAKVDYNLVVKALNYANRV